MKHNHRWLTILVGTLIALIIVAAGYIGILMLMQPAAPSGSVTLEAQDAYDGITRIDQPLALADYTLTNHLNEPFDSAQLRGKLTLFAFGFTHCPDICPLTLGEIRGIHEALGEDADRLNYVFISVDGNRDTPAVLRDYLQLLRVDSFMTALTGSEDAVRAMSGVYGVEFLYGEADASGNYSVDHTAGMFLLDTEGAWIRRYAFGTLRSLIVNDIQAILRG